MTRMATGLTALTATLVVTMPAAEARSRSWSSDGYYERQTESRNPVHGYSGWVWGGRRSYYCDYQRLPNRECTTLKSGKQRCRVTSWTLKQYCY